MTNWHYADRMNLRIPDFQKGLEWVNSPPLSLQKELKGKVSVYLSDLPLLFVKVEQKGICLTH